jgi:DNA-binding NtrC family response regulator
MTSTRSEFTRYTPTSDSPVGTPGYSRPATPPSEPARSSASTMSRANIRVLVVDDDRTLREGCASVLRVEGFNVTVSGRGDEVIEMLQRTRFDIMLVDVCMSPVSGIDVLHAVMAIAPSTLVILMTGNPSVDSSIEAMRIGAWDYLPKPYSGTQLQLLLGRAAHAIAARQDHATVASGGVALPGDTDQNTYFGNAPAFVSALNLARRVAPSTASVMIVGETGTGKELLAQMVHRHSRRANQPLVAVNCAAIPEQLLESEMFGHRKGAFTGADRDKMGLLEVANGGTLFLDELTEMSMALQAKMLRAVQDRVVRRVGSEHEATTVDVRFVSATNRDPREAIRDKKLREDLYYRLNVVRITLPPLRERPEDVPLLAKHFLQLFWTRHRAARETMPELAEDTLDFLASRTWSGNVRELQNFMEHAVVLAPSGDKIHVHHLPSDELVSEPAQGPGGAVALNNEYHASKEAVLAAFEKQYVTRLVARAAGNMSRAARLASVDRTTLYRLLERHGFRRDMSDPGGVTLES